MLETIIYALVLTEATAITTPLPPNRRRLSRVLGSRWSLVLQSAPAMAQHVRIWPLAIGYFNRQERAAAATPNPADQRWFNCTDFSCLELPLPRNQSSNPARSHLRLKYKGTSFVRARGEQKVPRGIQPATDRAGHQRAMGR